MSQFSTQHIKLNLGTDHAVYHGYQQKSKEDWGDLTHLLEYIEEAGKEKRSHTVVRLVL